MTVVDNGSTDGTANLAERFGDSIVIVALLAIMRKRLLMIGVPRHAHYLADHAK